ncbi:hypothetical protein CH341_31900, partial [Rhodoplanes roseus]
LAIVTALSPGSQGSAAFTDGLSFKSAAPAEIARSAEKDATIAVTETRALMTNAPRAEEVQPLRDRGIRRRR